MAAPLAFMFSMAVAPLASAFVANPSSSMIARRTVGDMRGALKSREKASETVVVEFLGCTRNVVGCELPSSR